MEGAAKQGYARMSRTEVLKRYGITDGSDLRVNTVKEGDSPLHLVGISAPGDPIRAIPSKRAIGAVD
jgi:hypothetical protein